MLIKAAIVNEKNEVALETLKLGQPRKDEVLVKIVGTGICHTDLTVLDQEVSTPLPIVLGHEGAGVVEKVGEGVTEFEKGDHVVITFAHCGECKTCKRGKPGSCEYLGELLFDGTMRDGTTPLSTEDGKSVATLFGQSSLATHSVAHKSSLVKVDKDVDLSILGPLGCGIQTGAGTIANQLKPEYGTSIAIFGCGAVGLSAVMIASQVGCKNIIAVDIVPERLELAKELGATHVLNGSKVDTLEEIDQIVSGGVEYAFETTGVPEVVLQSIRCLAVDGTVAVVAVGGEVPIHIHQDLVMYNRTIIGSTEGLSIPSIFIPQLIEEFKAGNFPIDKLITKYSVDDLHQALEDTASGKTIKPVVVFE